MKDSSRHNLQDDRDITDEDRAGQALSEAERRLKHVVASSPAVLFTLTVEGDSFGGISWMSENIAAMLGYRVPETLGTDWWMNNIHPDDRDVVVNQFRSGFAGEDRFAAEYRFLHKDRRYRWMRNEIRLLRDAAGRPIEAVGAFTEITERKRLDDQTRQTQKMEALGHLAGRVAHDFNNLLIVICGYSEILLAGLTQSDPTWQKIHQIKQAGDEAAALTRQLQAFSRCTVLEPRILNLNEVVREQESTLRQLIGEDVSLFTVLDPAIEKVKVDPGQIIQVIMNLAANARKAMPQGGRLTLETSNVLVDHSASEVNPVDRPGRYVRLSVTDTGVGIHPGIQDHIVESFFTTKGTGLGLATVYGIVTQSGGYISVDSEPGKGTAFKIDLPVAEVLALKAKPSAPRPVARGTETILLIEDEDVVRSIMRVVLREAGYTTLEASRGTDAIQLFAENPESIDLVITDVAMPEMAGHEVVRQLVAMRPGLKVLFVSGYPTEAIVRHGLDQAEVTFLQKPFSTAALTAKVREVLDGTPDAP